MFGKHFHTDMLGIPISMCSGADAANKQQNCGNVFPVVACFAFTVKLLMMVVATMLCHSSKDSKIRS